MNVLSYSDALLTLSADNIDPPDDLKVKVFCGSIAEKDPRTRDANVVTAIEL